MMYRMGGQLELVELFIKAGADGQRMGACPFCQRVYMVSLVKAQQDLLKLQVHIISPNKPPEALKRLGLKHLPALVHGDEGFDTEDDIVEYLDNRFPGGGLEYNNPAADIACQDFFSKFCFFVKAVNQDSAKLDHALHKLNNFLEGISPPPSLPPSSPPPSSPSWSASPGCQSPALSSPPSPCISRAECGGSDSGADSIASDTEPASFLCGPLISHLDCAVLPKLQHLRVAAAALKEYHIPAHLTACWRYLHVAYCHPIFVQTCPCDQEIILHWHDRPETKKLSHKKHAEISKETPRFSFDVPVRATVIAVVDTEG